MARKAESAADVIARRRARLSLRADWRSLLGRMLLIGAAGYVCCTQLFLVARIGGMEMSPALKDGDLAIVFRIQRDYAKNDVIAYTTQEGLQFGRIVACENDVVLMDNSGAVPMRDVEGKVITILRRRDL